MNDTNKTVILIILKDGKVLMEQRAPDSGLANHFLLPGGKIEINEDTSQAAKREGLEELGITITELVALEEFIGHESRRILCPFLVISWTGEVSKVVLDKGNPVFWVDFEDISRSPLESVQHLYKLSKNHLNKE